MARQKPGEGTTEAPSTQLETAVTTEKPQPTSDNEQVRELQQQLAEKHRQLEQKDEETRALMRRFEERMMRLEAERAAAPAVLVPKDESPAKRSGGPTTIIINQRPSQVTLYPRPDMPLRLKPGANPVPTEKWALARRHPHVQKLLGLGENPFGKEGLRDLSASTTRELSVADAVLLVKSATSMEDLQRAVEGEQRAVVRDAVESQAKRLADAESRLRG